MINIIYIILGFILVPIACLHLAAPLLILKTLKLPARVKFDFIDDDDFLSSQSDEFGILDKQIRSLGFEYIGSSSSLSDSSVETFFSIYSLEHEKTTAMLTAIENDGPFTIYVEFSRKYTDGTMLDVNNIADSSIFPKIATRIAARYPEVKAPQDLYEIANKLDSSLKHYVDKVPVPRNKSDCSKALEDAIAKQSDLLVDLGYCHREVDRDGKRAPTIKGAYLMTWRRIFPGKKLQEAIDFGYSKRLLSTLR